jgi:hypothetical protein
VARIIGPARVIFISLLLSGCVLSTASQEMGRVKVAEGEYRVSEEGDLGVGPIETEIFHFHESWTLWRAKGGEYELEGNRAFESPRGTVHDNRFVARLTHDLRLLEIKEFARLNFRRDSGPLTCELLPQELHCASGARDPAQGVDVHFAMDRPYGLIWPLSAFSLAQLTRAAPAQVDKPAPIQVVQLEELGEALPVLAIRSDGLIRYLGQSEVTFTVSGKSWRPNVYELTAGPVRKITIWTSPDGLLLVAERPGWPKGKIELVRFTKFEDF